MQLKAPWCFGPKDGPAPENPSFPLTLGKGARPGFLGEAERSQNSQPEEHHGTQIPSLTSGKGFCQWVQVDVFLDDTGNKISAAPCLKCRTRFV